MAPRVGQSYLYINVICFTNSFFIPSVADTAVSVSVARHKRYPRPVLRAAAPRESRRGAKIGHTCVNLLKSLRRTRCSYPLFIACESDWLGMSSKVQSRNKPCRHMRTTASIGYTCSRIRPDGCHLATTLYRAKTPFSFRR